MSPASYQTAPPRDELPPNRALTGALRAGNGTRTRDPNLGKVVLYQLSYSREADRILAPGPARRNGARARLPSGARRSGGEGDRTPDLVNAIHALSQLSYAPIYIGRLRAPDQSSTKS